MKYLFIDLHRSEFRVTKMCHVLNISRSALYTWKNRSISYRDKMNQILSKKIKEIFETSRQTYGSPRVTAELKRQNIKCSRKRVARLMQSMDLQARTRRKFHLYGKACSEASASPNIVKQRFEVEKPDTVWVSDITYLPAIWGWLYLVAILDLYSRRVVGWAISKSLEADFVFNAIKQAVLTRRPEPGLIFHSDRGCQYSSRRIREFLKSQGIIQSMSRKGNCYDNAVVESFFATLKSETLNDYKFRSILEAQNKLFDSIEIFYNRFRIHSTLNNMTPFEHEYQYFFSGEGLS